MKQNSKRFFLNGIKASILLSSFVYVEGFAETISTEGIIDNTHKNVVTTLNENVENLPEPLQNKAKGLVKDIEKDGKNMNYFIQLTNLQNGNNISDISRPLNSYLIGTVGISLLPNTWKINISYGGVLAKDVLFTQGNNSDTKEYDEDFKNNGSVYLIDKGETDFQYIDLYMKPLSTKIGNFGFGYKRSDESVEWSAYNGTILDLPNSTNNGAYTSNNSIFIRNKLLIDRFYSTYSIPTQNNWLDGLGVSLGYEKSNNFLVKDDSGSSKQIIYNPNTIKQIYSFGISKTLEEIKSGFSFKTLRYGFSNNTSEYYDYSDSKVQKYKENAIMQDLEMIYLFKTNSSKKLHLLFGAHRYETEFGSLSEAKWECGVQF